MIDTQVEMLAVNSRLDLLEGGEEVGGRGKGGGGELETVCSCRDASVLERAVSSDINLKI